MQRVEAVEFDDFEWDVSKRLKTLAGRGIDFRDVAFALLNPHLEKRSDKNGEVRTLAVCESTGKVVAVVYTPRGSSCRIISARPARRNERREYSQIFGG